MAINLKMNISHTRTHNDFAIKGQKAISENIYANKKLSKRSYHNYESAVLVLFCYQKNLNVNTTESWLIFRYCYLYTW